MDLGLIAALMESWRGQINRKALKHGEVMR